jgi:hypothetical protein
VPGGLVELLLRLEGRIAQSRIGHHLGDFDQMVVGGEFAEFAMRLDDDVVAAAVRIEIELHLVDGFGMLVHLDFDMDAGLLFKLRRHLLQRFERRQRLADHADGLAAIRLRRLFQIPRGGLCDLPHKGGENEESGCGTPTYQRLEHSSLSPRSRAWRAGARSVIKYVVLQIKMWHLATNGWEMLTDRQ